MSLTKKEVLENLDQVKDWINQSEEEKSKGCFVIKHRDNNATIFQTTKTTMREAVEEAVSKGVLLEGANLKGANLEGANLEGANLSL